MIANTEDLPGVKGPGVATPKIKELDKAVEVWRDTVDKRMALTKKEVESRETVIQLMHKHEVARYPYGDDQYVELIQGKEKVKLKHTTDNEADADSDED